MKQAKQNKTTTAIMSPEDIVAKHATNLVIRDSVKLEDGRILPTRYATYADGMVLGVAGRLIGEKKFTDHFTTAEGGRKPLLTTIQAAAVYAGMASRYQKLGKETIQKTMEAVEKGNRVVTQFHWDFIKGTNIIRTKAVDDKSRFIEVAGTITEVNGKKIDPKDSQEIARLMLEKGGTKQ
jgi:hypothetical protein